MIKYRLRELTKSFGSHVDPEKTEQLKRTKTEIENNVTRIRKLIKNEEHGKKEGRKKGSKKESELLGLIEDFYKEYQSLYSRYDHLIKESEKFISGREDSDSEYYSSDDIEADDDTAEHPKPADGELEVATSEVADLKLKLASTCEDMDVLKSENEAASTKIQEKERMIQELRTEADQREKELLALLQARETHGDHLMTQFNELENQLSGLKAEMDSVKIQNRDLEEQKEGKTIASKEPTDENTKHHPRVSELELILEEKENERSTLLDKIRENDNNSAIKIAELMEKAGNMQMEVDYLHAQKGELEERLASQINESSTQAEGLMDQIKFMKQELNSICQQKTELEEKLNKEISQNMIQIESLKEEITSKAIVEKQTLEAKVKKELTLQLDYLRNEKDELQKQTTNKNSEIDQLRLEKESLHARVLELKTSLTKAEDADRLFQAQVKELQLQVDSLCKQKEDFVKHMAKKSSRINELNLEKDSMSAKVLELEILLSKRGQECALQVDYLCNQKEQLEKRLELKNCEIDHLMQAKVLELEGSLTKREDDFSAFHKENELEKEKASLQIMALTTHVNDLKQEVDSLKSQIDNLELQSKKQECPKTPTMTEYQDTNLSSKIADQLRILKEQENKASKVRLCETKPNLLVVERKIEDFAEKCRFSIEDNIRILSRRILVAEQLQCENKENYRKIKEKYEKENEQLKYKIATYEAQHKEKKSLLETPYQKENEQLKEKIATYEAELKKRTSFPESPVYPSIDENVTNEIKQLKHNMDCLVAQLNDKEEQEVILKNKVLKLEAEVSKEGGENGNLVNAVTQLKEKVGNYENQMKEMDERLLSLGDEKREAIRQLCILIEYHRSQFDDLKKVKTKNWNVRRIKTIA